MQQAFRASLLLFGIASAMPALGADPIFADHLDGPNYPATLAHANRFLTQATFGPRPGEGQALRSSGYNAWIDAQIAEPMTALRPRVEPITDAQALQVPPNFNNQVRVQQWFEMAAFAPDQLRQKVAWALSQILVISDVSLNQDPDGVAEYWDLLARNAFGNYRTLLEEVTYSPQMGRYLTYVRNRMAYQTGNPPSTVLPDENYAREVMQLFSIGLVLRNLDFSPVLLNNQTIPTYDQTDISELARVFTGFSFAGSTNFFNGNPLPSTPNTYLPMRCFDLVLGTTQVHDNLPKTILDNVPLAGGQACTTDVDQALDALFNHPNVAPFIARQLIQRLVASNPSPAYIARVAQAFENNGSGVRGDLGAVVRAVLLDSEARLAPEAGAIGKPREPLLKLTAMWRAFNVQPPSQQAFEPPPPFVGGAPYTPMGVRSPEQFFGQRPLGAQTVFNFYEPDYQQPGPLASAGLYSPEFQIINEVSVANIGNQLRLFSVGSYVNMPSPPNNRALISLEDLVVVAADPALLVEQLNQRLVYGQMQTATRSALVAFLQNPAIAGLAVRLRIAEAIQVLSTSPEFATQP